MRPRRLTAILIALLSVGCQAGGSRLSYCPHCGQFHQVATINSASAPRPASRMAATLPSEAAPEPFASGISDPLTTADNGVPKLLEVSNMKPVPDVTGASASSVKETITTAGEPAGHH